MLFPDVLKAADDVLRVMNCRRAEEVVSQETEGGERLGCNNNAVTLQATACTV